MRILIRYFFRTLRTVLTPFLLLGDKLTTPKSIERDPADQARVDAETSELALYQFPACPFCVKVRRAMKRLALNIELRNAQHAGEHRDALIEGGGKAQVPCLRIAQPDGSVEWMYESGDIIRYLEDRFGEEASQSAS
ncbi:glutathione S-transferase N-terminal domain-containing protein [Thioalkalivibrio sp.]|uniref:glutathione S-transferase N-terminal domain-containing protein n=1 Tax=Thioalkalivibrio sp. TaxID=2093813 RepID=UPI0035691F59